VVRRDTRTLGLKAENLAFNYLKREGLRPVERNFRSRLGEIDLIMQDDDQLVFVEVRYRARSDLMNAGLTVDIHKQRKLIRTAAFFLARCKRFSDSVIRFDVVAINGNDVDWIRDAFRPQDASL
jgi:putative endonuclease